MLKSNKMLHDVYQREMWYKLAIGRKCDLCIYIVQSVQFHPVVIKVQEGQAVTSSS